MGAISRIWFRFTTNVRCAWCKQRTDGREDGIIRRWPWAKKTTAIMCQKCKDWLSDDYSGPPKR